MTDTDGGAGSHRAPPRSTYLLAATVTVALLPFVVAMVRAAMSDWEPSGDQAMQVLRMHDVATSHTPLLGPYSRFGWDHPGPLLFWLGAPALRLAGPVGVMVLVGVLNAASMIASVVGARRIGGDRFALVFSAALALMIQSHGATKLIDPWNPWVTVLPLLCVLVWIPVAAIESSPVALCIAILAGSFAAQSHLGNVPIVVAASAAGSVWWWRTHKGVPTATHRPYWALVLLVVLWSGTLLDQVVESPGNVERLVEFIVEGPDEASSLGDALGAAGRELGVPPAWAGSNEGTWPVIPAPAWTLLVLPAVLVVGHWSPMSRRITRTSIPVEAARPLAAYALTVFVVATFAVTRATGGFIPYVLRWTWPVAMFVSVVAAFAFVDGIASRPSVRRSPSFVLPVALVVIASGFNLAAARQATTTPIEPSPLTDRTARELSAALRSTLPRGSYGLKWIDVRGFSAASVGTGANLIRNGYDIDFPLDHAPRVGEFRATGRTDVPLLMIVGQTPLKTWVPPEGATRVLRWDHLSPTDRERADLLEAEVRRAAGIEPDYLLSYDQASSRDELVRKGADPASVAELHRLEADRELYEVWLAPPGTHR